jgi:two-component system, NtrC family, sensor kinase
VGGGADPRGEAGRGVSDRNQQIVDVLIRLSQGDMTARLERTYDLDVGDAIAYCVNMLAVEFDRLLTEREQNVKYLADTVAVLSKSFVALADGDYDVRVPRNGTGDPVDVLARLFNETAGEVQRAVVAIEEQRNVLEATLEALLDPVLLLDPVGTILRSNGASGTLFGVPGDALVGRPLADLTAEDELPFVSDLPRRLDREVIRDRDTVFRIAGGQVTFPISASAYRGTDGAISGIVIAIRDDRDLREARAQLQMTDRLAAMGTIAAGVAHEINNPLAFVMSNLDFLIEALDADATAAFGDDGKEIRDALAAAHRGSDRVRQIVQDLQTFSAADRDTVHPVDVNQLIHTTLSMLDNAIRHHARVVLELGDIPRVDANEAKLGQVFINLLHNAAQSIPVGRASENTIRVTSATDAMGQVVISIQDTGQGIEPRHLGRIFDAFYTTKPVGVGTGLGLAICHQVVTKVGGSISVDSKVGVGTTFTLTLPPSLRPADAPSVAAPEAVPAPRGRVLVIDDEVEVGQSVRRILRRQHDVDAVQRADVALQLLETTPYDAILCDVMMPEMTGMTFFERLRQDKPALARSVVFMSGGAFSAEAQAFLSAHEGPTVEKPFEARALRTLIDEVIGNG